MRMVRWKCGVSLRDRVASAELRERMEIKLVSDVEAEPVEMAGTCATER